MNPSRVPSEFAAIDPEPPPANVQGLEVPADSAPAIMDRVPRPFDLGQVNAARMDNYLLGGKDNQWIDRDLADRLLSRAPDIKNVAWFCRLFALNATQIAAQAGISQFLDLGSGIPYSPNLHEVAQYINPSARAMYVDYDSVAHAHCDALLANPPGVTALLGDIRRPYEILDQLKSRSLIDFDSPVAITAIGVLHYVMDDEHPADIMAIFRDELAPGSFLTIVHGSIDSCPAILQLFIRTEGTSAQVCFRSTAETETFLTGFELLEPGVVPVQRWLDPELTDSRLVMLAAIGRTPASATTPAKDQQE